MNAKSVLSKIATLLSIEKEEVTFTDAKSANGDILQSPTFDLNESVDVISEDGSKSPAPDGEYTISLKDSEGNENIIRIHVKDGKISERENVEEEKNETETEEEMNKSMDEEVVDKKAAKEEHMADEKKGALQTDEAHALPNTTDEDPRNRVGSDKDDLKDPIISLSYRIDEMEAKLAAMTEKFNSAFPEEGAKVSSALPSDIKMAEVKKEDEDEEELPKLDGAPVEEKVNLSSKMNNKKGEGDYQNSFLAKLYR